MRRGSMAKLGGGAQRVLSNIPSNVPTAAAQVVKSPHAALRAAAAADPLAAAVSAESPMARDTPTTPAPPPPAVSCGKWRGGGNGGGRGGWLP